MKGKKLVLYLDTSVIGGYYDVEFEKETKILFEDIQKGVFDILYSEITEDELLDAPMHVKKLFNSIPANCKRRVATTNEVILLADSYIDEKVVGETSRDDCYHIALATINKADILVSWNFKHIVNVLRIRGYNFVNIKYGYPVLDIRSPKEIIII
jgi:predicted nucleic acid-binding protein